MTFGDVVPFGNFAEKVVLDKIKIPVYSRHFYQVFHVTSGGAFSLFEKAEDI
jgi:hypothetical protein